MELREFIEILGKYRRLLLLGTLFFGFLGLGVSFLLPEKEKAILTLYVRRSAQAPSSGFYTYDGYYSQQAAEKYTDTVVGFLESLGILKQAAELVGLSTDQRTLKGLRKSVEIAKVAPQLVDIRATRKLPGEAKNLAQALADSTKERTEALNKAGDEALALDLVTSEPIVEVKKPMIVLNTVVGVLGGFLLSVLCAMFWEYLRS